VDNKDCVMMTQSLDITRLSHWGNSTYQARAQINKAVRGFPSRRTDAL